MSEHAEAATLKGRKYVKDFVIFEAVFNN